MLVIAKIQNTFQKPALSRAGQGAEMDPSIEQEAVLVFVSSLPVRRPLVRCRTRSRSRGRGRRRWKQVGRDGVDAFSGRGERGRVTARETRDRAPACRRSGLRSWKLLRHTPRAVDHINERRPAREKDELECLTAQLDDYQDSLIPSRQGYVGARTRESDGEPLSVGRRLEGN